MKSIKELLSNKTAGVLVNICRTYDLKGFSVLKRDGLINLIAENLRNPQFREKIQSLVKNNETTALILKCLIDNKNEVNVNVLRQEVLKNKSSSAFRGYYNILKENYILFQNDLTDDDLIFLPKEFNDIAKKVIEKQIQDEIVEEIEEVGDELKSVISLDQLLYSKKYTSVDSLHNLLIKLELPSGGNKNQLIERLLNQTQMSISDIIDILFDKSDLKEICRELGLPVAVNKNKLIENLLNKLSPPIKQKEKAAEAKKPILKAMASSKARKMEKSEPQAEVDQEEPQEEVVAEKSLKDLFYDLLSKMKFNTTKVKEQDFLVASISTLLNTEVFRSIDIQDVKITEAKKSSTNPTLLIEKGSEKLAISIWYFEALSKKKMDDLKARLYEYGKAYGKNIILYIYDHTNKISSDVIETFGQDTALVYKLPKDFE